jgi:F-type H+/Na+-transporting ATPase subunit beta
MAASNVFRLVHAGSKVSGLLGRLPSRVGYQPTLASEVAALHERITSVAGVSVTAIEAVYVPADDFTDPAVTAISSHLDSMIVLSRSMAAEGMYPAVDPLTSSSILLDPIVVGDEHYRIAEQVRETIAHYRELQDVLSLLGIEELSMRDRLIVGRARPLQRFLTQPFAVTGLLHSHNIDNGLGRVAPSGFYFDSSDAVAAHPLLGAGKDLVGIRFECLAEIAFHVGKPPEFGA